MVIDSINELVNNLKSEDDITSIGLSSNPIPQKTTEGDIDIFVYCNNAVEPRVRNKYYAKSIVDNSDFVSRVFVSREWGDADYTTIDNIETWIMYFRIDEVVKDFNDIIKGKNVRRSNGYYPSGRLAMFKKMTALLDKDGFLQGLRNRLENYPAEMGNAIMEHCRQIIDDEEDLERACERNDVLFFHTSIDTAIDAMLQYIFVVNKELFPGRKRNIQMVNSFSKKPDNCIERIKEVIRFGSDENELSRAFEIYKQLKRELLVLE